MPPPYNSSNSYGWPGEPMNHQSPSVHSSETSYEHGEGNHPTYHQPKDSKIQSFRVDSDYESLHSSHEDGKRPKSMKPVYIFWFLSKSRYYIRAVAIMVMVISVALILTGAVKFSRAMNDPRFDQIPKNAPITVHPCVVFTGVAALNLALSAAVLLMSCVSTKVRPQFLNPGVKITLRRRVTTSVNLSRSAILLLSFLGRLSIISRF